MVHNGFIRGNTLQPDLNGWFALVAYNATSGTCPQNLDINSFNQQNITPFRVGK